MRRGAIILCGGASARMGCDKATLPFGSGEVLLQRVVRLVGEVVSLDCIVCVAAPGQALPPLPDSVRVVHDRDSHRGPLAGLSDGLAALEGQADAVFACGCDTPLLVPALVERMFDSLGDSPIAAPHDGERFHPLAAVYRVDLRPAAEALLAADKRSLVALCLQGPTVRVPTDSLRDVDPQLASFEACNTLDEYQRILKRAGHCP